MMFCKGEYVVYRNSEICMVGENINRCFDGKNSTEYLTLHPTESNGTYYVPVDKLDICIRPVLSKDKLLEIIDSMPQIEGSWINDKNQRVNSFGNAVKSGDYSLILPMMNAIYNERKKRAEQGKHISSADEKAYNSAKHLLHSEIAYSLGISSDMVEQFIEDRIKILNAE